jgi:Transposase DDE domain
MDDDTPLAELVRLAKIRWRIEHDYRELKTGLGLDHFEGRSFTGWHRPLPRDCPQRGGSGLWSTWLGPLVALGGDVEVWQCVEWGAPRFPDSSLLAYFMRRAVGSGTRRRPR